MPLEKNKKKKKYSKKRLWKGKKARWREDEVVKKRNIK